MAKQSSSSEPDHNFEPTPDSGYEFEGKTSMRNSNGWGGTQTKLPRGHLARRDTEARAKKMKGYREDQGYDE